MKKQLVICMMGLLMIIPNAFAGDDKEGVKEIIKKETQAFLDKDYDTWAACWVHKDYVTHTIIHSFDAKVKKSWDSISVDLKKYFESKGNSPKLRFVSDFDVNVFGEVATAKVSQDQDVYLFGKDRTFTSELTYLLQKVDGSWKIMSLTVLNAASFKDSDLLNEARINWSGYYLLWNDRLDEALKVFELNTELYPMGSNTWDSLAEAYMKKGDKEKAIMYYKKSISMDPKNENAKKMIEKMEME